jgi:hypothetical protein
MKFVIDENLSPHLAHGMREFGEAVDHLLDHFSAGTSDDQWLPYVGDNHLFLITRDDRIRWKPAELKALLEHGVGAFFLGGKNRSRCDLIRQLVRNWHRIKALAAAEHRPFAVRIPPSGTKLTRIELR